MSDELQATTPKGILGGFEFTVFQRHLKEWLEGMDICLCVKKSNKSRFDSYSVRKSVLHISHITFRDCRVHIFPTTFLEIAECDQSECRTRGSLKNVGCKTRYLPRACIAQEIEEDGNKNRRQKGSGERQGRNKGKGERVRRE